MSLREHNEHISSAYLQRLLMLYFKGLSFLLPETVRSFFYLRDRMSLSMYCCVVNRLTKGRHMKTESNAFVLADC